MTLVLGVDVETTGLDPKSDEVIELGYALWDWGKRKPIVCGSFLMQPSRPLTEEIKLVTGIEDGDFDFQSEYRLSWEKFLEVEKHADYLMAHNATFDKAFVEKSLSSLEMRPVNKTWIDTLVDIEFDKQKSKYKNLTYLAATHGFVNPFPHRALFDVLSMLKIASNYDLGPMALSAVSPMITVHALVDFNGRDEAKKAGFIWNPNDKKWEMKIKKLQLDKIKGDFNFKITETQLI